MKLVGAFVSISILVILYFNTDVDEFIRVFSGLSWWVLSWAFLINMVGAVVFNSVQFFFHIEAVSGKQSGNRVRLFLGLIRLDFAIRFISLMLPAAVTAVLRWDYFNRMGLNKIFSGVAVITNKLLSFFCISLFSFIALSSYFFGGKLDISGYIVVVSFLSVLFFVFSLVVVESVWLSRVLMRFLYCGFSKSSGRVKLLFRKAFVVAGRYARRLREESVERGVRYFLRLMLWPVISFVVVAYSQLLVLNAFDVPLSIIDALLLRGVVLFALMLPFSFAGIGLREVGVIGVLVSIYSVPFDTAFAISLMLFAFQLLICLIGFLVSFGVYDKARSGERYVQHND